MSYLKNDILLRWRPYPWFIKMEIFKQHLSGIIELLLSLFQINSLNVNHDERKGIHAKFELSTRFVQEKWTGLFRRIFWLREFRRPKALPTTMLFADTTKILQKFTFNLKTLSWNNISNHPKFLANECHSDNQERFFRRRCSWNRTHFQWTLLYPFYPPTTKYFYAPPVRKQNQN